MLSSVVLTFLSMAHSIATPLNKPASAALVAVVPLATFMVNMNEGPRGRGIQADLAHFRVLNATCNDTTTSLNLLAGAHEDAHSRPRYLFSFHFKFIFLHVRLPPENVCSLFVANIGHPAQED